MVLANRLLYGLCAVAVALASSHGAARGLVYLRDDYGIGDLPVFAGWTWWFLAGLFVFSTFVIRFLSSRRGRTWLVFATVLGWLYGYAFSMINALLLGPWFGAWSFNVMYCWAFGASLGLAVATAIARNRQRRTTKISGEVRA